ncbi:Apolipoprotein C-I [Tupaia chinensis]|uniref:Apolipoprotein C-I n=1 Tax=Tupaia chinensis TaxID=246437 RepID=L9L7Z9_TUPCH|nr:Apolipoprotein C-I [Tupaia chinensis]
MRLLLSLPVLLVALSVVLEGPAPAQAAPDFSSTLEGLPDKLKEFGNTLEDKAKKAIERIKQSDLPAKTRSCLQSASEVHLPTFSPFLSLRRANIAEANSQRPAALPTSHSEPGKGFWWERAEGALGDS